MEAVKDNLARRAAKGVALFLFRLNVGGHRVIQRLAGGRPFRRGGRCLRSAQCCREPAIQVNAFVWYAPRLRRLFLWWQEQVNGFLLSRTERAGRLFVFHCTHFDPVAGSCDSYSSRPGMCRDYPRVQLGQADPSFLPGCGYRAVARGGDRLRRALEAQNLPAQQLERLKRDLHLEE